MIVVAVALLVGGIIFLFLDKWFKAAEERGEPELTNDGKAFRIGFFQVLAMVPGFRVRPLPSLADSPRV